MLSEVAEALLDSEDYHPYVSYDKRAVFHPVENTTIEQEDELNFGDNVTGNMVLTNMYCSIWFYLKGIEPFETVARSDGKRKQSQSVSQSKRKKRTNKSMTFFLA